MKYNNLTYFYRKNAQNDIIALLDNNSSVVVKCKYDAWGNCQTSVVDTNATEIANLNPFRYRSYYFDTETDFYFLKTRYYDPEIGRFITIDDISYLDPESINGLNLYAYCGNNPVMNIDPNGNLFLSILIGLGISVLIGAAVGAASYTISAVFSYATTGNWSWSWGGFVGAIVGGAIAGGISFFMPYIGVGAFFNAFIGGTITTASTMIGSNIVGDTNYSVTEIFITSLASGLITAFTFKTMDKIKFNGFNSGRGSFSAVYHQTKTSFLHGQIEGITSKTFGKILTINMYEALSGIFYDNLLSKSGAYDFLVKGIHSYTDVIRG